MQVRVVSGPSSCIVAIIYRPGFSQVSKPFFDDLADVLYRLSTFVDPIFCVGDVNIRLNRPTDSGARGFNDVLEVHGMQNCVMGSTHDLDGLLDAMVTRNDLTRPSVEVFDVGLSDHRLLQWRASLARPCTVYNSVTSRPWGRLDTVAFRAALSASALCSTDQWSELSMHDLAQLYNSEVTNILDTLVPLRTVSCRRCPSDPWFDEECRIEKRCVRQLEREASAVISMGAADAPAVASTWTTRRRLYRIMLRKKHESF